MEMDSDPVNLRYVLLKAPDEYRTSNNPISPTT